MKHNLEQNITIFSSIGNGFFNILTSEMINDLKDAPSKKEHWVRTKLPQNFRRQLLPKAQ